MDWLELTVQTTPQGIEETAAALTAGGFSDLMLEDQAEFESFLEDNRNYWDYIDESLQQKLQGLSCIKLYLEQKDTAGKARLEQLLENLKSRRGDALGTLELSCTTLAQTNWEESWKDNYPPQEVGSQLVVLPYWLSDTYETHRRKVILDPGLTFGTGAHPSTQMVMEAMEETLQPGMTCLDLGSGSGILSITALALGAKSAIGVDVDPKAEDIARENSSYNGFGAPEFSAYTGNVLEDQPLMDRLCGISHDLVLVNIVADVIIPLAPVLPRLMGEQSQLILSGILDTRLQDVLAAIEKAGLVATNIRAKEDWRCVQAKRRAL